MKKPQPPLPGHTHRRHGRRLLGRHHRPYRDEDQLKVHHVCPICEGSHPRSEHGLDAQFPLTAAVQRLNDPATWGGTLRFWTQDPDGTWREESRADAVARTKAARLAA